MRTTVIGIDCATQDEKVGIALGEVNELSCRISHVQVCSKSQPLHQGVLNWIPKTGRVLLAIDAPLGWPVSMGRVLHDHSAGQPIAIDGNTLFRRETDRFVKSRIGQQPLDVGADRIARTALAGLTLLGKVRSSLAEAIPLAWTPSYVDRVAAIEVYPAATLKARGIPATGYKKPQHTEERRKIIKAVREAGIALDDLPAIEQYADALDAALCVVAASDFLRGYAMEPVDVPLATKEGWIWVRKPLSTT